MSERRRFGGAMVYGVVLAVLLTGCWGDDSDDASETDPTDQSPTVTPVSTGEECGDTVPKLELPPEVDPSACRWTTQAEDVVGFGDLVIATAQVDAGRTSGQFVMKALEAETGEVLWRTPSLEASYDNVRTGPVDEGERSLEIVHWDGEPYAAFTYQTRVPGLVGGIGSAATFVPLGPDRSPTPVSWTVEPTGTDPWITTGPFPDDTDDDAVTATVQATEAVVDPSTGELVVLRKSWDGADLTVGDGWFADTDHGAQGFTVRRYDGSEVWDSADHVPDFAPGPAAYRKVVAAYGDYVLATWASCLNCDAPLELAVHDAETGEVLGSGATFGGSFGDSFTRVLASPDERWLVVTDDTARVVVDLDKGRATSVTEVAPLGELPPPETELRPLSVTDAGRVYAVDGHGDPVAVDGASGEVTPIGGPRTILPSATVGGLALVSTEPPEKLRQRFGDYVTTTWWAFDSGETTRAELAERLAPMVYLARGEPNPPMDASVFLENAELWFDHGRGPCLDEEPVAADPDAAKLAAGEYTHEGVVADVQGNDITGCTHEGRTFRTNEPGNEGGGAHGFYLDLDDDVRDDGNVQAPTYWQYYDNGDGTGAFVYWLFYPYNDFGTILEGKNQHEGDWERVAVRVDGEVPTGMTFWHHGSKETCYLPWGQVQPYDDTHPVVYSAKGSHGSYPRPGHQVRDNAPDDDTSQGAPWATWENPVEASDQEWWRYRGLWGSIGPAVPYYSGIDGPYPDRDISSAVTTSRRCADPQQRLDERLVGVWVSQGPVDQPSSTTTYHARLILRGGVTGDKVGTSTYPGLGCDGDLTLIRSNAQQVVLRESITRDPQDTCVDTVTIRLARDGQTLRYVSDLATATLVRDCSRPVPNC